MRKKPFKKRKGKKYFSCLCLLTMLLFANVFSNEIYAENEVKKSISVNNVTVNDLVKQLGKKFDYSFFISDRQASDIRVSVHLRNATVTQILSNAFSGKNISFVKKDRSITIFYQEPQETTRKEEKATRARRKESNPGNTVKGVVRDEKGQAIIGATITVKGSSTGTISDINGDYSVAAGSNDILVITYVGYTPQEIAVNGRNKIDITVKEDVRALNEVVVIGYGTQRKGDVTSSVASIKAEDFVKGAVKDAGQLIEGKIAGLAITNPSGDPTSTTQIMLRGTNTIGGANTAPLILIDGIPGNLNTVAPEDIESIDVLKDGSAAAIYGSRATNGVILISTKQTKGEKINSVQYDGYISTSQIARKLDMLTASSFRKLYPDQDHGANTNWLDEITRTPISHVHNLSLEGGNSVTNYIANINYSSLEGIMLKSDNETFRGNIDITHHMFDNKLMLKFGIFGRQNQYASTSSGGSTNYNAYSQATRRNPTDPVKNSDGSWNENLSKFEYENPVALLEEAYGNVKNIELKFYGNILYNPVKDLSINTLMSFDRQNQNTGYSETMNHISNLRDGLGGWSSVSAYTQMEKLLELTAQYKKMIGQHNFTILGGYSYDKTDYESMYFNNYGFQDDYFGGWHNIGIGSALKQGKAGAGSSKITTNLIGFFGRATYAYMDKYLLMASLRYEGASQLWGTGNEWGSFPSVSLGWRITNEPFMKRQRIFDDLKLRVGYGVTGSQPASSFLGVAMLNYGSYAYVNGQWVQTIVPASNANPDLKWEEKKETNVGLDYTLLQGRIFGTIDIYNRTVNGLIYNYSVPTPPNLYPTTMANGGTLRNRGIEVLVSAIPFKTNSLEWKTDVTFSTNSNKLLSLSGSVFKSNYNYFDTGLVEYSGQVTTSHRVQVGEKLGNFWGFKVVDVDANGKWIYLDRNGKKVGYDDFTHAPEDKHVIGNGIPKWYAGWNNTFSYKNFDLNVTMRGAFGFQIINGARMNYENTKNSRDENRLKSVSDKIFGKVTLSKNVEPEFNSYYVENGDYWKIDNMTIGYTFNKIKNNYIKSIRVYGSVINTFTITSYKGVDPEVSTSGLTPGYDSRDQYPSIRSFTFGVGLTF